MCAELPYLAVSLDLPGSNCPRPPMLEGFVPDMLAETIPRTITVIGEAKSENDLESEHSFHQLLGYFRYLSSMEHSALVISVPWPSAATARAVVKSARNSVTQAGKVRFYILDGVTNECSISAEICH
jgi:hypothetical protein